MSESNRAAVSPFLAGLLCRCPRCGTGKLFRRYLVIGPSCPACGLDFSTVDTGDGPAVFVILVVGFLVVGAATWLEMAVHPPMWVHLVLWLPAAVIATFALLPPFKATLVALQYRHKAREGRLVE